MINKKAEDCITKTKPPVGCFHAFRMLCSLQKEYKRNGQDPEHGHIERHITNTER